MDTKVEIKKVVIKIGDKELSLSIDEAKELKTILNQTFGGGETIYVPTVIREYPPYVYPHWTITYGDSNTKDYSSGTMLFSANTY